MADAKTKDVNAAKGSASPGGENNEEDLNTAKKQMGFVGPKKQKAEFQPNCNDNEGEAAMRGMSSSASEKFWKESGYKIPKKQGENHFGGKKPGS